MLTDLGDLKVELTGKTGERRKIQQKIRTEVNEDQDNEEFLHEMLKKNPS